MDDISTVYADIIKVEKDPKNPAFRIVNARISDETKDLDGQRASYDWLKTALPEWFKWGNVRDMHENNVVGKGKELIDLPGQRAFDGVLKVVDPMAVMKLDEELFTGVSIGIKGPRVINQKGAAVHPTQPGTIIDGRIVEISLVDHPCNENCKLTVAKGAASGLTLVKGAKLETVTRPDLLKTGGFYWYKRAKWNQAARDQAAAEGRARPDGSFPVEDASDISDAVHLITTGHGDEADRAHIKSQAKRLGKPNPFKKKNAEKIALPQVSPADLETYKSRFHPAFANAGVALADGSYVIMDEGDLFLAKALRLSGFGNTTAADILIKRRESELIKAPLPTPSKNTPEAAAASQQATPRQPDKPKAPGARDNRDNDAKNAPPPAKNPPPQAPGAGDKDTPAQQSPDASGSKDSYGDTDGASTYDVKHPPTKPKKKDKTKIKDDKLKPEIKAIDDHTHADEDGALGQQTDTGQNDKGNKDKAKANKKQLKKFLKKDPSKLSDKQLVKVYKFLTKAGRAAPPSGTRATTTSSGNTDLAVTNTGPDSFGSNDRDVLDFQRGGAGSPGGGRALIEQLVRNMQGRVIDYSQGPQYADVGRQGAGGIDAPQEHGETGPNELLNNANSQLVGMRDGDPRLNANTPASALGQSGPMQGGDRVVSPPQGNDPGVPNTSLPFKTAPQAGAAQNRMYPGALPDTLAAPGDVRYASAEGRAPGKGGMDTASPALRAVGPAAQAGPAMYPSPVVSDSTRGGVPNSAFAMPSNQPAPPGTASGTGAALPGVAVVRGGIGGTRSQVTNTAQRKGAKPDKKKRAKKMKKSAKLIDKLAKAAVADRVETAIPDSTKAVVAGLLKKFTKNLEKNVLAKYATADQLKALHADIEKLGAMAAPGGPFVGKITAVDKEIAANEFARPQTQIVGPDALEQIERFERLSKSDNRQLAASASTTLRKLLEANFPGEILEEVTKRKRSAR